MEQSPSKDTLSIGITSSLIPALGILFLGNALPLIKTITETFLKQR